MKLISLFLTEEPLTLVVTIALVTVLFAIILLSFMMCCSKRRNKANNQYWRYQEELLNALGSNIDDVFIIFDVIHVKYEYISPNFEKSLGINKETLINNYFDLLKYIPEASCNKIFNMISNPFISGMTEIEFEFLHPSTEKLRWIMIRVYPIFRDGQLFRYVASISDITKEKAAQKALEEALDKLKDSNQAKKEFLSHVSHELKTPINAIIGMSQIASISIDDRQKVENCLKRIGFASGKLLEMINNILDISKIDSNKIIIEHVPLNLKELLDNLTQIASVQTELNHLIFHSLYTNIQDYELIGDDMRLLQILSNCLSNAIKFTPVGGTISFEAVETDRTDEKAVFRFTIKDTGKGMSPEYLDRLFVPFEQEDKSIVQKYGGTGLGMSITKSLVNLMGGDICVDSKINEGTCIRIDLPFPINKNTEIPTELKSKSKNPYEHTNIPAKIDYNGCRVLIVEDNEINQEITIELLKQINFDAMTACDGYEAVRLFEESELGYFNFILMDLIMPGRDGYETTKEIRNSSHPDAKKVCIIAMTADNLAEEEKSMEYGMNYHITKPFKLTEFYSIIQKVMEGR